MKCQTKKRMRKRKLERKHMSEKEAHSKITCLFLHLKRREDLIVLPTNKCHLQEIFLLRPAGSKEWIVLLWLNGKISTIIFSADMVTQHMDIVYSAGIGFHDFP